MKIDPTINRDYINVDPLRQTYYQSIIRHPRRRTSERLRQIALLCIDMQYLDAAPGYGVFADATKSGVPIEAQEYYCSTLKNTVLPNVRKLQDTLRKHQLEVIHCRIQSLTKDGRDRSPGHKRLSLHAAPNSKEAEFLEEVAPIDDEIIINKTASGVFSATNLEFVLRNLGVELLYVTGVYTNECVETTVRDACDLGFFVTMIEDGCTTVTQQLHEYSVGTLRDRYARILTTDQAIEEIESNMRAQEQEEVMTK